MIPGGDFSQTMVNSDLLKTSPTYERLSSTLLPHPLFLELCGLELAASLYFYPISDHPLEDTILLGCWQHS